MTPDEQNNTRPDIEALLVCGKHLSDLHSLPPAPEDRMRAKIKEILFERRSFACYQQGILKREELRNLILAHMNTLIFHCAGVNETDWRDNPQLEAEVERALID